MKLNKQILLFLNQKYMIFHKQKISVKEEKQHFLIKILFQSHKKLIHQIKKII